MRDVAPHGAGQHRAGSAGEAGAPSDGDELLAADHAAQRVHALRVQAGAGLGVELGKGVGGGARAAVGTVGGEGVEHIGDREDAHLQRQALTGETVRVAGAVDPLVMVLDELEHQGMEAAQLGEEGAPVCGMALHDVELLVREAGGLLEHLGRHGELADVVQEPAGGQETQAAGRQMQVLAHLHGEHGDALHVAGGRRILVDESIDQRRHARTEELGRPLDEGGAAQAARQRPGRHVAREIDGGLGRHQREPDELQRVTGGPARVARERRGEREMGRDQPEQADAQDAIERSTREQRRATRTPRRDDEQRRGRGEEQHRAHAAGPDRHADRIRPGDPRRADQRGDAEGDQAGAQHDELAPGPDHAADPGRHQDRRAGGDHEQLGRAGSRLRRARRLA